MKILIRLLLLSLLTHINISIAASDANSDISFIGSYTYNNAPALIVQFNDATLVKNSVSLKDAETKKTLPNNWVFNNSKTALIYPEITVGKKYTVTLAGKLRYKEKAEHDVIVYEKDPSVEVVGRGPVVPIFGKRTLPISTTNVKQVSIEVLKVTDPVLFLNSTHYSQSPSRWDLQQLTRATTPITHLNFEISQAKKNQSQYSEILIPDSISSGWYLLVIKPTGAYEYNSEKVVQVALTDIGIQTKVFPDSLSVQLSSLSTSDPITHAFASVFHKNGKETKLGNIEDSIGSFNYAVQQGDVLSIKKGDQVSYLALRELPLDLSDYPVSGRQFQDIEVFSYSNRDLFRPGEEIPLNLLLRGPDGKLLPNIDNLYIEYVKPDQTVARSRWLQQGSVKGYFNDHYSIPKNAPMGKWIANIKLHKDAKKPLGQFIFSVNEFVPERMDLTIDLEKNITANAKKVAVNLHGKYLFGAPAAKNTVKVRSFYQPTHYFDSKYSAFYVGEEFTISPWRDVPDVNDIKLDDDGKHSMQLPLIDPSLMKSPVNARFTFELLETSGATVSRNKQRQLWSGKEIAGIKSPKDEIDSYSDVVFEIALLNKNGDALLAGEVDYTLERNVGGYYWVYNESSGWSIRNDNEWRPVNTEAIQTLANKATPISLNVEWGRYRITLRTKDGVITRLPFWAGWSEGSAQQPVKPDQLSITLDKNSYRSGDKVTATIFSKTSGQLQLNLDADRTLQHQVHTINAGKNSFTFTLEDSYNRHDLYLTATLLSTPGSEGDASKQRLPQRFFAISPIVLERSERILSVNIDHGDKLLPLEKAEIKVKLDKPTDKPTWVTLSLMDRGIVNLSNYHTSNIASWFFDHRRYQGDVIDLYSRFYQTRPDSFATRHRYGGDQEVNLNINKDDLVESKTITIMSELVQFNENGEAVISVDIPDYNGQAQVVAMVFNDDQFGQAESNVIIAAPIVAELSIPRFLAPNDQSETYVEVFNTSGITQRITATVNFDDQLISTEKNTVKVTLKDGERHGLSVPFKVESITSATASTTLSLSISSTGEDGSKYEQTRDWTLPIRTPEPVISQRSLITLSTLSDKESAHQYQLTSALWRDYAPSEEPSSALVSYSRSPQLNIADYADGLFRYPYGCAEQTTSKGMPWLFNASSLAPFKNTARNELSDKEIIEESLAHLSTMQKANGSFSLWNKFGDSDPWLSMYVTDYLLMAEQTHPDIVPKQMLTQANHNLRTYIGQQNSVAASHYYALWLGSKQGIVNNSHLHGINKALAAHKDTVVSYLSYAHIAGAFLLNGQQRQGEYFFNKLLRELPTSRTNSSGEYEYGSKLRDFALTIAILNDVERVIKLSNNMITLKNRLAIMTMELANQEMYLSTQERIALIRAGIALSEHQKELVELDLSYLGKTTHIKETGINQKELFEETTITNASSQPVFIQIATSGLPKSGFTKSTLPIKQATRTYRLEDGSPYLGKPLKVGDKLIVTVNYKFNRPIQQALVVEFLPTGFVLENPEYTNSNQIINAANIYKTSDWTMLEYRNDRLIASMNMRNNQRYTINYVLRAETSGTSMVPPMFLEEMYQPQNMVYEPATDFKQLIIQ